MYNEYGVKEDIPEKAGSGRKHLGNEPMVNATKGRVLVQPTESVVKASNPKGRTVYMSGCKGMGESYE